MKESGSGQLRKADRSDKNWIVITISAVAALVVAVLLAAAAKIRGSKAR